MFKRALVVLALALTLPMLPVPWNRSIAQASTVTPSAWDQPALSNPVTIDLSSAAATQSNDSWAISQSQDVKFFCSSNPVLMPHDLSIWGGHNVVIDGCTLQNTDDGRGIYPHNQGAELWMHDVRLTGQMTEGIDLQEPGSVTAVMRDVSVGSSSQPLQGSFSTNHADGVQTWSGPSRFLVDGLSIWSQYQCMFLLPDQWASVPLSVWDFRNTDCHLNPGGYVWTFGTDGTQRPDLSLANFYADGPGQPLLYAGGEGGEDIQPGSPPNGPFVTSSAGADETSDPMPFPGEQ